MESWISSSLPLSAGCQPREREGVFGCFRRRPLKQENKLKQRKIKSWRRLQEVDYEGLWVHLFTQVLSVQGGCECVLFCAAMSGDEEMHEQGLFSEMGQMRRRFVWECSGSSMQKQVHYKKFTASYLDKTSSGIEHPVGAIPGCTGSQRAADDTGHSRDPT